jgi:glycosyltransferase involved in cell wall biosynthesis
MALRRSYFISAKSKFLADRIKSYGVCTPVCVNYWGADLDRFHPRKQVEIRRKLRLDENAIIILSPRAIEPRLNIHLIVEAFHEVLPKYANALLVILGRSIPSYKKQIENIIERLNLRDKVCVLDEVSQEVLLQYYQASDVVVSMAQSEGFPNTLLEVMACRVPIVVGRIEQIEELLQDDVNAWVCGNEPQRIAAAILDALDSQDKRQRITNVAYKTVKEYADIRKNGVMFCNDLKRFNATYKRRFWLEIIAFRALYIIYRIQRKIIARREASNV